MSSPLQIVLQIVTNTPLWVWPLMALVVWLGLMGLRTRRPAAVAAGHPAGRRAGPVLRRHRPGRPAGAGPGGLAGGAWRSPCRWASCWVAAGPCDASTMAASKLAGGWFMLVFGISIFAVRYALGVVFGMAPALRADPAWIAVAGGVGGFVARHRPRLAGWRGRSRSSRWVRRLGCDAGDPAAGRCRGLRRRHCLQHAGRTAAPARGRFAAGHVEPGTWRSFPPVQRVAARDGAPLAYRLYPARA